GRLAKGSDQANVTLLCYRRETVICNRDGLGPDHAGYLEEACDGLVLARVGDAHHGVLRGQQLRRDVIELRIDPDHASETQTLQAKRGHLGNAGRVPADTAEDDSLACAQSVGRLLNRFVAYGKGVDKGPNAAVNHRTKPSA